MNNKVQSPQLRIILILVHQLLIGMINKFNKTVSFNKQVLVND
jgi:hypothetical protein